MRITNTLVMIAIAASLTACADDLTTDFDVEEPLAETRVEGLGTTGVLPSSFAPVALDIMATDAYQDEDFGFLTAIQITEITLEITANSEGATDTLEDGMADDFSFMSELAVNVVATLGGERQTVLVGTLPMNDLMFAPPNSKLDINMTRVDIRPFVESGSYALEISAQGAPPPDDVIFDGTVVYRVGFGNR